MITIQNYVKVKTLEEAWELNQARSSRVLGGMMWLRLGAANVKTAINLSALGLNQVEESDGEFTIGALCTLRQLELHPGLRRYFGEAIAESVRHIVGVQFRNQATVGGSIFGRYGFSDVLTCLLALDTEVELYRGGRVSLKEFAEAAWDRDILTAIHIRKDGRRLKYQSVRQTKTDFPQIACAVAVRKTEDGEKWYLSVGARPAKAALLEKEWEIAPETNPDTLTRLAAETAAEYRYGTNMRGSAEYRQHLAEVLIARALRELSQTTDET